jgi:hypothetical protein
MRAMREKGGLKRTPSGAVQAESREKHASLSGERFPVADRRSALAALRLRGHTKNPKERKRVIAAAVRYAPAAAKAAKPAKE